MKKAEMNAAFRGLAQRLSPTEDERTFVSKVYASIKEVLGEKKCLQIGSYPRFTAITPLHDLDILYVLGPLGEDPSNAISALGSLERDLRLKYRCPTSHSIAIARQTHSITISFREDGEEVFAVDIVPAYIAGRNEFGEDTYLVPEIFSRDHRARMRRYAELAVSNQQMDWITSDPRGYIQVARQVNDANSDFRKAVKVAKAWKQACCEANEDFKLKSFHLEQIITAYFQQNQSIEVFDAVFQFFCDIPSLLEEPKIPDRADPCRMIDAYVAELTSGERDAVIQARDYFLVELENVSKAADLPRLLHAGFRRRVGTAERFLFDERIPVLIEDDKVLKIEGFVLLRDGFRPFTLDTRGLVTVGRQIRFRVSKAVESTRFYKWKVRNDDSSPQTRGEITDHRTASDPERTAFPGKHYVECYAIRTDRTDICIARARQNVEVR